MAADKTSPVASAFPAVAKSLAGAVGKRMISSATQRLGATTERLTDYVSNGAGPGLVGALTGRGGGGSGPAKDKTLKVTNIVEHIDIGAPIQLVYDQWSRFTDFPTFMKKVESVQQLEEDKLEWRAQILWSHRTWTSTIVEQVPDKHIIWRSEGQKGSVDGSVTFHALAPDLTRVLVVLQYHPQGFFERTGNLWRAQGRRARLELKHFARHVMNEAVLHPEEVEGWRGEIHDGEVTPPEEAASEGQAPPEEQEPRAGGREARAGERGPRRDQQDRPPRREGHDGGPPRAGSRPAGRRSSREDEAAGRRGADDRPPARQGRDR